MKCKECNREKHYCTSCDYDYWLSEGFCNQNCFFDYPENQVLRSKLRNWIKSLNREQLIMFKFIVEEVSDEVLDITLDELYT